jgi:hypothetical protein
MNKTAGFNYWTSGTDRNCSGKLHWCSEDVTFKMKDMTWAKGQPSADSGDCVFFKATTQSNTSHLSKGKCSELRNFICEVILYDLESVNGKCLKFNSQARQQGTEGQQIVNECVDLVEASVGKSQNLAVELKLICYLKMMLRTWVFTSTMPHKFNRAPR